MRMPEYARVFVAAMSLIACSDDASTTGAEQSAGSAAVGGGSGGGSGGASGEASPGSAAGAGAIATAGTRVAEAGASGGATPEAGSGAADASAGGAGNGGDGGDGGPSLAGRDGAAGMATGAAGQAASGSSSPAANGCTRELLRSTVDRYFAAIAAHDASALSLAANVKFTENGMSATVGDGFWKTAGMAKLKRTALDPETCSTVTESVVTEEGDDIVFGLRLKLVEQKIVEIETIVVREGDYLSNPMALLGTASDDWETVLPADQQPKREDMEMLVRRYFSQFPAGACNFAESGCARYENGFTPGACDLGLSCSMSPGGMGRSGMETRLTVHDVEAGIAVGFTMFAGRYTDFHMFKLRGGLVTGLHAVLAEASGSGWE